MTYKETRLCQASSSALLETPAVNAVIDDTTNEIVYRNYNDISVAVASPTGLVVPVLRNTEKMSFAVSELTIIKVVSECDVILSSVVIT